MIISHIAAMTRNRIIGRENRLPWKLPGDMAYFKNTTMGHYVIMGRKNFEAEGRPLPGRTNIVLTKQENYDASGCTVVHSIEEALNLARENQQEEVFIIGGGDIYEQTLDIADLIYLTIIDTELQGDVYYPALNMDKWKIRSQKKNHKDERNPYDYTFYIFEKFNSPIN